MTLTYKNWKYKDILDAVIPSGTDSISGYSRIGHVIHLNLRDMVLPYKTLIGQVLLDKIANIRTVVNKTSNISNTYRNFSMEVLAGESDTVVEVVENNCRFKLDFAKVYWNPRLGTERDRILKLLHPGDILLDAFAGVGPFVIPAAKKGVKVLANDLNPDAFYYLEVNKKFNKVEYDCFNMDAREFLETEGAKVLKTYFKNPPNRESKVHFVMNLPATAVEFLSAFIGILADSGINSKQVSGELPMVHVYCFTKSAKDNREAALSLVETHLGRVVKDDDLEEIVHVRSVAPTKEMMRVSFRLGKDILFKRTSGLKREDEAVKRRIVDAEKDLSSPPVER